MKDQIINIRYVTKFDMIYIGIYVVIYILGSKRVYIFLMIHVNVDGFQERPLSPHQAY